MEEFFKKGEFIFAAKAVERLTLKKTTGKMLVVTIVCPKGIVGIVFDLS